MRRTQGGGILQYFERDTGITSISINTSIILQYLVLIHRALRYCKILSDTVNTFEILYAGWANTAVFRARYGYSSIQYQYLSIFSIKYCSIKVYFGVFRSISSEIRCSDTVLDTVSILLAAARDTDTPVILILQYSKNTVFPHPGTVVPALPPRWAWLTCHHCTPTVLGVHVA